MAKLLFVVHRYPPGKGGSEYYVQGMAEESLRRGHDVTVLADYNGEHNGVKVTKVYEDLYKDYDLIIVHGADIIVQNTALACANILKAPVLYLIIKPSNSPVAIEGLQKARFLGCSTPDDISHCVKHGVEAKMVKVRHSIPSKLEDSLASVPNTFKERYGIKTKYMFLTAGGFWHHKAFHELVDIYKEMCMERGHWEDVSLVCLGYMNQELAPDYDPTFNVMSFVVENRRDVIDAIGAADLYIMNSTEEGYGLVLLEAMLNKTPWASRRIAGAIDLKNWGFTYEHHDPLYIHMHRILDSNEEWFNIDYKNDETLEEGKQYILDHRLIGNTVDDIEKVIRIDALKKLTENAEELGLYDGQSTK